MIPFQYIFDGPDTGSSNRIRVDGDTPSKLGQRKTKVNANDNVASEEGTGGFRLAA